ncbi:MAG: PAS domain-containing protein [Burkholderiales bacterium]|nr:PAS domain-containing protein [Burkholderiales bacterium]
MHFPPSSSPRDVAQEGGAPVPVESPHDADALAAIVGLVRQSTQVDVTHYKDSTFRRQLHRRMLELGFGELTQYLERLQADPAEVQRLQQSLLISVTHFFRDPEVFARLGKVLSDLVASKQEGEGLRLWVPGCATGEEAYTIAILVAEALGDRLGHCPVRLFATDIDQEAIFQARQGQYSRKDLAEVAPELVQRYFVQDEDGFRVNKPLRDLCVFAHHDLLSQPPFVNLDLISCRNVLIYFQADVQREILGKFHHALRPRAWLLLGQSESVGASDGLYESQDAHLKLFMRGQGSSPRLHDMARTWHQPPAFNRSLSLPTAPLQTQESQFHQILLKRSAPPSVLVDTNGRVLHLWGDVSRFMRLEGGRADFSLVGLCLTALRGEVRTLMHLAIASAPASVESPPIELDLDSGLAHVRLSAQACMGDLKDDIQGIVISFEATPVGMTQAAVAAPDVEYLALTDELTSSREHLHALVRQLDQANAERQALHEELQASSEELQSSNEELQASNEELTTVNEQLLGKSEELSRLNDLLLSVERSLEVAMVVLDQQMRVQRFNPLAVRIFGLLKHDVGRYLASVPCSLPLNDLPAQIAAVMASGEALVTRVDEDDRHYVMQISPLRDVRGQQSGVILSFTDVAELRQAEAERAQLAAIVTSSDDAIIGQTLKGVITSWNPGAERLLGYTQEEALGQFMALMVPPECLPEEESRLARIAEGEKMHTFDTVRVRCDGQRVPVSMTVSSIRNARGNIVGVSKIFRDISLRRALEAEREANQIRLEELVVQRTLALAEKERHLQSILDGVPGMVAYWGADLRLRYANSKHRAAYRQREGESLGVHISELLSPAELEHGRAYREAVLRGEAQCFEASQPLQDDGVQPVAQINFVPDLIDGVVQGFIVMVFDITAIKRVEAEAASANQAKSEFLASMSHEIRTPLNAVLGLAQVAQRRYADAPVVATFAQIVEASQHLLGVINDVLDFSKIEAGKFDLQIGRVVIAELLDKSMSMVAEQARAKGVALTVSCDPQLAHAYAGDPVRVAQVLINLLTNAVKFTESGHVDLIAIAREGGVAITVRDTGIGMSPAVMSRIFSPFMQGDGSTTRRFGGTGLGLSICKRLVTLMHGRIEVSSEPSVGSSFDVWLPLPALQSPSDNIGADRSDGWPGALPGARLQGMQLLVAEDHPVNQLVLREMLAVEGAEMVVVANGALAVEQVRAKGGDYFDLVLCDIEMPVMDGYEATRQIKLLAPGLPVIGLTAHAFQDARQRGQEMGMSGYVTKPYLLDDLVDEILKNAGRLVMFRQACETHPALLDEALQQSKPERLCDLARSVAGMAANVRMPELSALADRLVRACERSLGEAAPLVAELNAALREARAHLGDPSRSV